MAEEQKKGFFSKIVDAVSTRDEKAAMQQAQHEDLMPKHMPPPLKQPRK